jgi:hypothetical protein
MRTQGTHSSRGLGLVAAIALLGLWPLATPASAGEIVITKNRHVGQIDGQGGVVKVIGNKNAITVKNASQVFLMGNQNAVQLGEGCPALELMGNQNAIQSGPVKTIRVTGNQNHVSYRLGPQGTRPAISDTGRKNTYKEVR